MSDIFHEIKIAWRSLLAQPAFSATAVVTLALGIGLDTTVFSLVNAVVLRPLPVHRPERLVEVYTSREGRVGGVTSYADLKDYQDGNTVFSGLAARSLVFANVNWEGRSELLVGELATSNYFDVLGIRPRLGRYFVPEEEKSEGSAPVTVLNSRFWQSRYNGDPGAIGRTLQINGTYYTIVGVAPEGFDGMLPVLSPDFWLPIMMAEGLDSFGQIDVVPSPGTTKIERRGYRWLWVTGRLRDGVTLTQAQAQMKVIHDRLASEYPESNGRQGCALISTDDVRMNPDLDGYLSSASLFLLAAVGIVLLVACSNVAGMFLARASTRRREMAIRLALGTGRWRLMRLLLIESTSVALAGGIGGLGLALAGTRLFTTLQLPIPVSFHLNLQPDWRVFAFALGVSLVTGVVFGLVPALQATRTDLVLDLKGQHSDEGRERWRWVRGGLVVGQLALSLVLLIGGVLLIRSLDSATRADVGFKPDRFAMVTFNLDMYGYDESRGMNFFEEIQRRFAALPGVEAVTTADRTPFSFNIHTRALYLGETEEPGEQPVTVDNTSVGPGYFETMEVPIVEGRGFGLQDRPDTRRVAVVSEAMVQRFWPGQSPLGQRVRTLNGTVIEVVGVSRDYKVRTVGESPRAYIQLARDQSYAPYGSVIVRTRGAAMPVLPELRRQIAALDPELVPFQITTLAEEMDHTLAPVRLSAVLLAVFGVFTVFLAAVGLYGVMAYSVGRRVREIGVRVALGATPRGIVRLVMKEGLWLIGAGVILGAAGAAAAGRLIQSLLYGISSVDWLSFLAGALILSSSALAASIIPALTASKSDPITALRAE